MFHIINNVLAYIFPPSSTFSRRVQVLPEEAALHSLPAGEQRPPAVGQRLGPAGALPPAAELPGGPAAEDPAHSAQALWPQHPLSPQPQPPNA